MTPGGYHSFDHRWALSSAFNLHRQLGKDRVAERIHTLNTQMKHGLRQLTHVRQITPMSEELSSGIVCFEVDGRSPQEVVAKLLEKGIVATTTPYHLVYSRVCPSLLTLEPDVDATLRAIAALS